MSASSASPESSLRSTPFIIGVTGHMKLESDEKSIAALKSRISEFYEWLRRDPKGDPLDRLGPGLGISEATEIIVMTSLAPGADQIAAEVAREFVHRNFSVMSPLPFEREQYMRSTTFSELDEKKKEDFRDISSNSFEVTLADERQLSDEERFEEREPILKGEVGAVRRHAHQRAAGEYIATYCDLLLAVTDPNKGRDENDGPAFYHRGIDYRPGSMFVVKSRRRGTTAGLLPVEPDLPWADVGPVVYLPWRERGGESVANEGIFSYDAGDYGSELEIRAEKEVVEEIAELIDCYNRESPPPMEIAAGKEMRELLGLGVDDPELEIPSGLREPLLRLAGGRRRAADFTSQTGKRVQRKISVVLGSALLSAILFMIYSDWETSGAVAYVGAARLMIWWLAVGVGVYSLISVHRLRSDRLEGRQIESRCIAEGLRAQFYWSAAGTGNSVASNYLLRQRGTIRWITNTISAASAPYERVRREFLGMTLRQRHTLLRAAVKGWCVSGNGKGQIPYFENQERKIEIEQLRLQAQGWTWFFGGVGLSVVLWLIQADRWVSGASPEDISTRLAGIGINPSVFSLAGVLGLVGSGLFWSSWMWNAVLDSKEIAKLPMGDPSIRRALSGIRNRLIHWLESPDENSAIGDYLRFDRGFRPNALLERLRWLRLMTVAVIGGGIAAGLAALIAVGGVLLEWEFLPTGPKIVTLAKNILFACSARAFLAGTLAFHTENLRNYRAMSAQFRSAWPHLEGLLDFLDARCRELPCDAMADPVGYAERAIEAIQRVLVALGREALSEHAEWLHLRRDRPVSPNLPTP